jgi:hypothetical protein
MKVLARALAASIVIVLLSSPTYTQTSKLVRVDPELFSETIECFHRLLNAIDIGSTLIDYRRELLDTTTATDPLLADFPDCPQRDDIEEALKDYKAAADVWQEGLEYGGEGIPTKTDFYRRLRLRYEGLPEPKSGRKVKDDVLVKLIWRIAQVRIEHAIKIQNDATRN